MKTLAILSLLSLVSTSLLPAADWPQWRGPERTDIGSETGLLDEWPEGGPKRVWLYRNAGVGYAGPAIVDGRLYTMGTRDDVPVIFALDAKTGKEIWVQEFGTETFENGWGDGPRGTPTVDGKVLYALSGGGMLVCARTTDGKIVWQKSMGELGGKPPSWGYSESPLVDGPLVVVTPGGSKGAIAALDKKTGALRWQSKDFTDGAQYSSLIIAKHNGSRQYIQLTMKSVVGVDAQNGDVLWETDWPGRTAVIPTPIFDDGHVYITSGYGVGCSLFKIGAGNRVESVYRNKVMKNQHGGVILLDGHLYGYSDGVGWACQEFKTGELVWNEKRAFRKGSVAYADGKLFLVDKDYGNVALIDATTKGWKERGSFKLDPQTELRKPRGKIWTHPVILDGLMYLRDQDLIYCYDVKG